MMAAGREARIGAALAMSAAFPGLREQLEASMALHMLVQIPLLVLAGFLLTAALSTRVQQRLQSCNVHGLSGWLFASLATGFWMLPRALDESLALAWVEVAKFAVLLAAGLAIRLSWSASGPIVQAFFIGNWAWMTATAGLLYLDSPQRLCNAYLSGDQALSGLGLLAQAVLAPVAWAWLLRRRGAL